MIDLTVDEWTQKEYLTNKQVLAQQGIKVILVDTILNSIEGADGITYNPPLMKLEPAGTVFVFYCDSGKGTHSRLKEFRAKFPDHVCISLKGGRGYWRKNLQQ
jgi:hypothetical protein